MSFALSMRPVSLLFIVSAFPSLGAVQLQAQAKRVQIPMSSASSVHAHIEVKKQTVRVGDPAMVRVTLRNASSEPVVFTYLSAARQVGLRVLDATGAAIKPTGWRQPSLAVAKVRLPGKELLLRNSQGKEWVSLEEWGYDLRTPGSFTIVGIPMISGPGVIPDGTVRSNQTSLVVKQ
jgi:hypothetical protein